MKMTARLSSFRRLDTLQLLDEFAPPLDVGLMQRVGGWRRSVVGLPMRNKHGAGGVTSPETKIRGWAAPQPSGEDASVTPRFFTPLMFESMHEAASDECEDVEMGENDSGCALLLCVGMETSFCWSNEFEDFESAIVTVSVSSRMSSFVSSRVTSIRGPAGLSGVPVLRCSAPLDPSSSTDVPNLFQRKRLLNLLECSDSSFVFDPEPSSFWHPLPVFPFFRPCCCRAFFTEHAAFLSDLCRHSGFRFFTETKLVSTIFPSTFLSVFTAAAASSATTRLSSAPTTLSSAGIAKPWNKQDTV